MNNVAVTGSHGYIGSVLRKMLDERGLNVHCCDNRVDYNQNTNKDYRDYVYDMYTCSFDDDEFVSNIIRHDINTIYHLAATSLVGPDLTDPMLYYWNNTGNTINFVRKLIARGWDGHIVFSSTAAVYESKDRPLLETSDTKPLSAYGISKLQCEHVLNSAHRYGINTTSFRFFNVAGAYDEMGEEHEDTHLVSRLCVSALSGTPLVVYGADYPTADGTCIRDYVDVRDICRAQIHASDQRVFGTYNLGTKTGTSVKEMIDLFNKHTLNDVKYNIGERRFGDAAYLTADPSKFESTGFKYNYDTIDVITSSWEYFNYGI